METQEPVARVYGSVSKYRDSEEGSSVPCKRGSRGVSGPRPGHPLFATKSCYVERRGRMVRMSDSQPEGRVFESRRRHGVWYL
jgi:hypothetical protein